MDKYVLIHNDINIVMVTYVDCKRFLYILNEIRIHLG